MSRGADLFVICKSCGSEVSPYITECPYCGSRLRKRAPKLDREGMPMERISRRGATRRSSGPRARPGRPRRGEMPGIRWGGRPHATIALVVATLGVWLAWRGGFVDLGDLAVAGPLDGEWWRVVTTQFAYDNGPYQFVALVAVGVFGWLLERRHGPVAVLLVFFAGGAGGALAAAALESLPLALGANGGALALLAAWAVPDLRSRAAGEEIEGDLLGAAAIALVILLMPAAEETASAVAGVAGGALGLAAGYALARFTAER